MRPTAMRKNIKVYSVINIFSIKLTIKIVRFYKYPEVFY